MMPVNINGENFKFSAGKHNELQKAIIEEFAPRFAPNSECLYVGDTIEKDLVKNVEKLKELGFEITLHDKMPDVVLYREDNSCHVSEISFMLNDASGFRRIYLATGYTDLRRGMEGLASIIKFNFQLDPYQKDILFLFCGRRTDRIKGLVWEGDGFLLLYKRLELGAFNWPRTKEEALEITPEQYQYLMQGLEIVARHPIQEVRPDKIL